MKKSLFIILMVCLAVVGLVSCKNEVEPAQEELIYVSFEKGSSRALTATLEDFDVDDFYWSYEAQKNDGSGLRSGQTVWNDTGVGSVAVQAGKGLDDTNDDPVKVPGFSKGYWNFRLFGYTDAARTKLAYWGEADSVLIDNNHHMAEVTVSPVSGAAGYLRIGTITFVPASGISVPTDLVIYTDQLFELEGTQWVLVNVQPVDGVYTLDAKQYKFTRTYSFDGIPVANGSVIATVYSNLTTTVSGTLSELTTYAEFGADQNPDIVRETWGSDIIPETSTADTVVFQKNLDPAATNKVASATMPAAAAVAKIKELEKVVGADDNTTSTLKLNLSVDTMDVKQQSVTYDIGMEAVLTYTKNLTQSVAKSDVKNVTKYVLIDINLTSDISDVTVTHSGEAMILTDDMSRAGEQGETDPKYVDVNKGTTDDPLWVGFYQLETTSTGKVLHLKTKSFSPFKVALEMTNYVAAVGKNKYTTLTAAIAAAEAGDTIIILDNITTDAGYLINKNLSIDTHGYTITVNEGSSTDNNRAFKVAEGKKLSVYGGGTIDAKGASGTGCYGAFRAEVGAELNLEGITLKNYRNNGLNVKVLGGTATLKNVTIISSLGGGIEVTEADLGTLSQTGKATLTDCTFTQTGFADWCSTTLSVSGGSELIVNSGSYTSDNYALYVFSSGGVIKVNGGTFSGNKDGVAIVASVDLNTYPQYTGGLALAGGTFAGGYNIISPAYMVITGGTFDHDPTTYVAEGYFADYDDQTQKWTVIKVGDYVATVTIGDVTTGYYKLEDAFARTDAEYAVALLKNVSVGSRISVASGKTITLDLNGNTITGTEHAKDAPVFEIADGGALTIDGTDEGSAINADATAVLGKAGSTLTVNGGSYSNRFYEVNDEGEYTVGSYIFDVKGTATIDGITITDVIKGIRAEGSGAHVTVSNSTADVSPLWGLFAAGEEGELRITSGTYRTTYSRQQQMIDLKKNGKVIVSGGSFETVYNGDLSKGIPALVVFNSGNVAQGAGDRLEITGGTIKYAGNLGWFNGSKNVDISISGGTFDVPSVVVSGQKAPENLEYAITGGTFTTDPSAYVAPGYRAIEDPVGTWTVVSAYDSGSGTSDDPYIIKTATHVQSFYNDIASESTTGVYYKLGNDVAIVGGSASAPTDVQIGPARWELTGGKDFKGDFDGGSHKIYFSYEGEAATTVSLFGNIKNASIHDLEVVCNIDNSSNQWVAAVCMFAPESSFSNVTVSGLIKSHGDISGFCYAPGEDNTSFNHCTVTANLTNVDGRDGTTVKYVHIGLFAAQCLKNVTFDDCSFIGTVNVIKEDVEDTTPFIGFIATDDNLYGAGKENTVVLSDCSVEITINSAYGNVYTAKDSVQYVYWKDDLNELFKFYGYSKYGSIIVNGNVFNYAMHKTDYPGPWPTQVVEI